MVFLTCERFVKMKIILELIINSDWWNGKNINIINFKNSNYKGIIRMKTLFH